MKIAKGFLLLVLVAGCAHVSLSQYGLDRDHSRKAVELPSWQNTLEASRRYLFEEQVNQEPISPIPVISLTRRRLDALPGEGLSAIRFGHSTVLLKLNGKYWLTDPVFSDSLGPVYAFGIKRFHQVPLSIEDLPDIEGVLISHNHYDHLDQKTIEALHSKVAHFIVPIGNGEILLDWGVSPDKITELDWWEEIQLDDVTVAATPANHLSGRAIIDQNQSLWSSWVIKSGTHGVYFSGDSGYSSIFKQIGERYGPFDLTLMENGSYDRCWASEHLTPEETVKAHLDLKGRVLLPVHNSTFDLAFHEWNEPLEKVSHIAAIKKVSIATPVFGHPVTIDSEGNHSDLAKQNRWWRSL